MAAPTWARARARARARVRARMGTVEMAAPTWARAGQHPACVRACARFRSALRFSRNP